MRSKNVQQTLTSGLVTFALTYALTACAAGPELVFHTFTFDALADSPGVEILDHRYGDSKFPGASNPEHMLRLGKALQRTGITGEMRRPDSLYVKWKVLAEDRIYEDTVDLRDRLPRSFANCTVYFKVQGPQLYVFLIYPERSVAGEPPHGLRGYESRKVVEIYPGYAKQ